MSKFKRPNKSKQMLGKRGSATPHWKGGIVYIDGRRWIYAPNHPNATHNNRYVCENRYVMSQHLNRPLMPNEIVHHKNGEVNDNRIENLIITTRRVHNHIHNTNLSQQTIERQRKASRQRLRGTNGRFIGGKYA